MILRMLKNPAEIVLRTARNEKLDPQFNDKLNFGCSLTLAGYGYPFTQVRSPHLPLEVDGQFDCDVWWNEVARGADGQLVVHRPSHCRRDCACANTGRGRGKGLREHPQNPRRRQLFPHGCRPKPLAAGKGLTRIARIFTESCSHFYIGINSCNPCLIFRVIWHDSWLNSL